MEIIIALIILIFAFKYVVLNVRVNSILLLILGIVVYVLKPELIPQSKLALVLIVLNIIDCIRDVVIYSKYYEHMSDKIDGQFAFKSVLVVTLIVLGWFFLEKNFIWALLPRAIFLILVYPIQYLTVLNDVSTKLERGFPIPYHYQYYDLSKKKQYWYQKILNSLKQREKIISNTSVVIDEFKIGREKFNQNYPQSFLKTFFMKKARKADYEKMKNSLTDVKCYKHMAYIGSELYSDFSQKLYQVLTAKNAVFSPYIIKSFSEFENLNLNYKNGTCGDTEWSIYFIIKALSNYVKSGKLYDYSCNDKEPLDNHSYGMKIKSHNANDNPLLALDDD